MRHVIAWIAMAGSAVALSACREVHGEAPAPARAVKVMEPHPAGSPSGTRYAVTIQPSQQIPLAFKSGGYVDDVLQRRGADGRLRAVQAGDAVPAGARLARVREGDYRERLNQAQASLAELQAAMTKATLDRERARALYAAEALTKVDLDAAEAAYDANAARLANARAQIELAGISLRDTALVAPRSGVILDRKIENGTLVGSGTLGFVLVDIAVVKAVFGVPDSLVGRITLGQPLDVTSDAFPGERFTGRVTGVSPAADQQTRVFDIELSIPNADARLRPGMIGGIEIPAAAGQQPAAGGQPSALAVPLAAIVRPTDGADRFALFVAEGRGEHATVRSRTIALGGVSGNLVTVANGLSAGERVVVMGASLLKDGETVRVIP
jgi:multidrug efflux system membrane fusion protein